MRLLAIGMCVCAAVCIESAATLSALPTKAFTLASYNPPTDGEADATQAFTKLFGDVRTAGGGRVTIPPGTYLLAGKEPITLVGNTHVTADGAVFLLPGTLGDKARVVLFAGEDVCDFSWRGGEFRGRCFDPAAESNTWEPNTNTRAILITTSPEGKTRGLLFRDIKSAGMAGAVVTVLGVSTAGSESEVANYATDVTVENCILLDSGKFMWDYGYLWQITVWPEEHTEREPHAGRQILHDLAGPVWASRRRQGRPGAVRQPGRAAAGGQDRRAEGLARLLWGHASEECRPGQAVLHRRE